MAYLTSMHSKLGKESLEKQTMELLPSERKRVSPEEALKGMKRLSGTELWKFVEDGATGECETVRQWVSDIADGRAPKAKLGNTDFLATAWTRMQYFVVYDTTESVKESDGKSKDQSKSYYGTRALTLLLADLKKKKEEEVSSELLKPLVALVHLLPSNKVADVKKLSEAAYARMSKKRPLANAKSSASDLKPKKSKTEAQGDAERQADDMFA
eukprot:6482760-Amphidinium_carterae.1